MQGQITSFRRGRHTITGNQAIVRVEGVEDKEKAASLVGKAVSWKSPAGNEIKGKVSAPHGGKGSVRAIFERGLPGQSVGTKVSVQ